MELVKFVNEPSLVKEFIEYPYILYRHDARYIQPLRSEQEQYFKSDSFIYQSGKINSIHFLIREQGTVVGRISAFVNSELHNSDGQPIGTLGLFECDNRYDVAHQLISQAISWLVSEYNVRTVWGPMNGDIWHGYRFMVRGFTEAPFVGEPYNKEYYPGFFERFGFTVKQEWDSVEIDGIEKIKATIGRGEERLRLLKSQGYDFKTWNSDKEEEQIDLLYHALCDSYQGFLGFTLISRPQFRELFKQLRPALDPDLFLIVHDSKGKLVGFAVAFPDLADAVRAMKGRNNLGAQIRFLCNRRKSRRLNFYIGGVSYDLANKATGLGRAGFYFIINRGLAKGYTNLLLTLRVKGNKAHGLAARSHVVPQREYALFEYTYGN
jgi:hypothetical protein